METLEILERAVERSTGEKVAALRSMSIDDRRRLIERHTKRPVRFTTKFPFIGRGNVMRDRLKSHREVEAALATALQHADEAR